MMSRKMGFPNNDSQASKNEPTPTGNGTVVIGEVVRDLQARSAMGTKKYGTPLKTFNGRNAMMDLYQEILDSAMYAKQVIMEQSECLSLNGYQILAQETAIYPGKDRKDISYPVLGLNGEAGEVADKFKKIIRDENGIMSPNAVDSIAKELGDCLWYIQEIAFQLGYPLEEIARMNIEKLSSRKIRGVIGGSGDNR